MAEVNINVADGIRGIVKNTRARQHVTSGNIMYIDTAVMQLRDIEDEGKFSTLFIHRR